MLWSPFALGLSAFRIEGEAWQTARDRSGGMDLSASSLAPELPLSLAQGFDQIDWERVPAESDLNLVREIFFQIRDLRFLQSPDNADFFRRISWLYPDDGCYHRAAFVQDYLAAAGTSSLRLFAFGNLVAQTDHHPQGRVLWWYHTAPALRLGEQVYILDPGLSPYGPLRLEDWILMQVTDLDQVKLSLCHRETYSPNHSCLRPSSIPSVVRAQQDAPGFLLMEWERQMELQRDPLQLLGDQPPWSSTGSGETH